MNRSIAIGSLLENIPSGLLQYSKVSGTDNQSPIFFLPYEGVSTQLYLQGTWQTKLSDSKIGRHLHSD